MFNPHLHVTPPNPPSLKDVLKGVSVVQEGAEKGVPPLRKLREMTGFPPRFRDFVSE